MRRLLRPTSSVVQRARHSSSAPISLSGLFVDAHSPLGVGAHATVYWGRRTDKEQDVAVKVMSAHASTSSSKPGELSNCIEKETRVFDQLLASGDMHPNVVDLVSQFVSSGDEARKAGFFMPGEAYQQPVHYFVTEFLGGGSLENAIKYKKSSGTSFEANEVLDVAVSVSEGLRFLHSYGVVHRDVKPQNLIYDMSRKHLKLIDFSLAGVAPKDEVHETFYYGNVGTKGFVAPEVLRGGDVGYGPSCDIFSLGCVLHEMLAGEPPSVTLNDASACVETSLPQKLSGATRRFVESLLAANPMDRPCASEIYAVCASLSSQWDTEGRARTSLSSITSLSSLSSLSSVSSLSSMHAPL